MTHQEDGDHHTPTCSAFFVPGEVVHAWRRNQKVIDLDRPDDKQVADKVLSLERAIERDTVPPPDKQMIVARKLGEFLTSKKARDVGRAIAPPVAAAPPASSETPMSEDERFLSEIPVSYRSKAKKLMRAWSQKGMTWDARGNIYLKGKPVRGGSLAELLHHASSGRRRNPPIGFGHVTRYMARQQLPPTAYANPRWRGEVWDRYTPSDSSTEYYTQGEGEEEDTSTVSESDLDVAGSAFPEWKDIK